jgi:surface protein
VESYLDGNPNNYPPLNNWDVSNVTNMQDVFSGPLPKKLRNEFNENIADWDVSNVTDMSYMFDRCKSFNQPLNSWNVSNVTKMHNIFSRAEAFNQPLDNWHVSHVTNFNNMFKDATSFNQSIDSWNIPEDKSMFLGATAYLIGETKRKQDETKRKRDEAHERMTAQAEIALKNSENSPYEECLFCAEPLDNINGPGTSIKCDMNCNDAVYICQNNHIAHRGCILQSCNSDEVDVAGQMGSIYSYNKELAHKNNCPFVECHY